MFFIFSGLFACYYALMLMKHRSSSHVESFRSFERFINVPLYLLRRLVRIWPSLIIAVFWYWYASWLFGSGPFIPWYQEVVNDQCSDSWWSPTFFISSLYPEYKLDTYNPFEGCVSWSWYLSVDIICFAITPVLLLLYYHKKWMGYWACGLLVIAPIICGILICSIQNLSVGIGPQTKTDHGDYFEEYYNKPYTRATPYFLGVFIAFCLQHRPFLRIPVTEVGQIGKT